MLAVKITKTIFSAIKTLQQGGAKPAEAAGYMNISPSQAGRIFKCESFEEYENETYRIVTTMRNSKQINNDEKQSKEVHHTVEIQATHYMMEELKKQTKLLELLSNKIAFIVDELVK